MLVYYTHIGVRSHHLATILMRDTEVYKPKERARGRHLITFSSLQYDVSKPIKVVGLLGLNSYGPVTLLKKVVSYQKFLILIK